MQQLRRLRSTPHESNTLVNCMAIAVGPISKATEFLWGFPSLPTQPASTAHVGKLLTTTQSVFMSSLFGPMDEEIPPKHIRCPWDVR